MIYNYRSFPVNYWDKFVKKKVRQKYSETYDFDSISNLLGMEKTSFSSQEEEGSGLVHLYANFHLYNIVNIPFFIVNLKTVWFFNQSVMYNV